MYFGDKDATHSSVCVLTGSIFVIEPRHEQMCLRESPTRPDTNRPVQLQKLARVLKFQL